ncbi:MAG: helix-turn-helix domain-containing protein [Patescibacteria group bacterium]
MIRKPLEKAKALELRNKGFSIKEIGTMLDVSSSTVSLWVRHIQLSPTQRDRLVKKVFDTLQQGRIKAQAIQKQARDKRLNRLTKEAEKELGTLSGRDLFVAGIFLYWAEGFKKDNRLGFANSDPTMIKLFLKWLEVAGVPKSTLRLRVGLNISHKGRIEEVQKYWEAQTGIPQSQFQKPFFQKFIWKKEYAEPRNYFGVLRIRANGQGDLFVKIQAWIKQIQDMV